MKKIPSLFARNFDGDHLVRDEVVPGSEWVTQGEGQATIKRRDFGLQWPAKEDHDG
jgi:polyisoprenoid-binding protein YceI